MQQEPNQPPVTQPNKPSVDEKIAAITSEVYTFEHDNHRSPTHRFAGLSRVKKAVIIVGACCVIFIGLIAILSSMPGSTKQQSAKIATNAGGSAKDNLPEYQTGDTNGDGIIDQYDVDTASSDTAADGEISWWQKILNVSGVAKTDGSTDTAYSDTNVAFEANQTSSGTTEGDGSSSSNSDYKYFDDIMSWSDENDYDGSTPIDIVITDGETYGSPVPAGGDTITFASWNTLYNNSVSNVGKGVSAVAAKADIIGFQELHLSDRRRKMRDTLLCSSCDFSGYVQNYSTNGSNPGSVAIVWRKSRFSVVKSGYFKVSDIDYVSTKTGSTGSKITGKWITWALLNDKKTGSRFYFMNTHTVASLESKGKPIPSEDDRVKNYTNHMNVLTSKIKAFAATGLPVFITGDFNVNYRYDHKVRYKNFPFARMNAIGVHSGYQRLNLAGIPNSKSSQGSGNRIIDYVWYSDSKNVYPLSESISSTRYGSDHYPVYFTANVR